ncbi:MAG: ABC transporter substrate-binding protein [Oscillospiraceae bacterium]|nr:ABC transporter substrate-binding protein [Oscillospiraceae bacterium]
MKNKKFQLAALGTLLAAVIAVGAWLVLRTPGESTPDTPPADSGGVQTPVEFQPFDISSFQLTAYRLVRQAEDRPLISPPMARIPQPEAFFFENQPCVFSYHQGKSEEDFSLDIVSMASGEILRTYGSEEFYEGNYFATLAFNQDGTLWCAYYEWESERVVVAPCRKGVTEDDVFYFPSDMAPYAMAVRDDCFVLSFYGAGTHLLDTSSGTVEAAATWENIKSFCVGEDGSLYLLVMEPDGLSFNRSLVKYSPEQQTDLWRVSLEPGDFAYRYWQPSGISYTEGGGLFLLYGYEKKLLWVDPATGEAQLLVDLESDVAGLDNWIGGDRTYSSCAVDGQNRLYFNCLSFDASDKDNPVYWRNLYVLEPDRAEVNPADVVTLTITAPYQVESVAAAARNYLRDHPEVELVWDTQFISREELQKNAMEYKDQIALRLMTGDVGDLVMVTGSGLGTETMTETDAFADLSGYLDACPFREELPDNLLEPLQGEDGAIRGLPLGVRPNYYVWNQELLDELGIDPYTVTWSQLLDLALGWKEQGTDLSLEISDAGIGMYGSQEQIFQDILLANLYDLPQANGSVRLGQPYLRQLLEKLKALSGSTQLLRSDGDASKALILSGGMDNGNVSDRVHRIEMATSNHGIRLQAAPYPLGEMSEKRQGYAFCWAISQRSKNQGAAWEFLQYLASADAMTLESDYSYTRDTLPANTAAQERWLEYCSPQWEGNGHMPEQIEVYFRQIQKAMNVPYVRFDQITGWYPAVAEPLGQYVSDELTLDEAMEQAGSSWERFLME